MNDAAFRAWGFRAEELIGRHLTGFVADAQHASLVAAMQNLTTAAPVADLRTGFVHKNGQILPLSLALHRDAETGLVFAVARTLSGPATAHDPVFLTNREARNGEERALYEARIEARNLLLGSILDNMNQVFFLLDTDLRVIYWNSLASKLFGVTRDEVMGSTMREWLEDASLAVYEPLVQEVLIDQRPIRAESICPLTQRWEEVDMFPTDGGVSVFIRDVHERKRTEEELRKLSLVAENTVNIVIISDAEGAVLWANRAAVEASGYSFQELIGRPIGEVVDGPETPAEAIELVQQRRATFQPYELEAINYRRDGTPYWVHVLSQPSLMKKETCNTIFR
ncbi:MAG: PAS domain S-box protein [Chitinophagaceae bacterium]|nr:MAG: PAS domain S-box protein [Chitinophagaceae bacterium]